MTSPRSTVETVASIKMPGALSPAIVRPKEHIEAVLAQSILEAGEHGRAALAWAWALVGTCPSPVTLSLAALGRPPAREEILAEADAHPGGSTAPPGVPTDFCDQLGEARRILTWLVGISDEIPVDDENRGRLVGTRDNYARSDEEIRRIRDRAQHGLATFDLPDPMNPVDASNPWRWPAQWMDAAWLRGVRDLLDWILGDRAASPLCSRMVGRPTTHDLTYEDDTAQDVVLQGRPAGTRVDPHTYPPPQYGEAVQATIYWLCGETTSAPVDAYGHGPYAEAR